VDVDLGTLLPAHRTVVRWHGYPIFVVRRTDAMLAAMQESKFVAQLADPASEKMQQPPYAKNWHRSIDQAYAVLVGICTRCGCVPDYLEADSTVGMAGGYFCPCCASRYDPAGRAYSGVTSYNLPVPPHAIERNARALIGKTSPRESFSLETVERI
jgi:ubiquinol-cytochrome c reductase iron-sulfur subunit